MTERTIRVFEIQIMPEKNKDKFEGKYLRHTGIGFEFVGAMGLCCFLGYMADRRWDSEPVGIIIGALVGIVAGCYLIIKEAMKMNQEMDKNDNQNKRFK